MCVCGMLNPGPPPLRTGHWHHHHHCPPPLYLHGNAVVVADIRARCALRFGFCHSKTMLAVVGVAIAVVAASAQQPEPLPVAPRLTSGTPGDVDFLWQATMGGAAEVYYAHSNDSGASLAVGVSVCCPIARQNHLDLAFAKGGSLGLGCILASLQTLVSTSSQRRGSTSLDRSRSKSAVTTASTFWNLNQPNQKGALL